MKHVFYGIALLVGGFLGGMYVNNEQPKVVTVPTDRQDSHIHINHPEVVYLAFDGKLFKLEVDGQWNGLTIIEQKLVTKNGGQKP